MYNTRKDTKKYRELVENYCRARNSRTFYVLEQQKQDKMLKEFKHELENGNYNETVNSALRMAIGVVDFTNHNSRINECEGIIKSHSEQLEKEYGEDLDKLYEKHEGRTFEID